MKLKLIIFFTLILCGIIFASCEKEIDMKLKSSEPRLVIEALLPESSPANVKITMSKNYGEGNEYPIVLGAIVKISDNEGNEEILTQETPSSPYTSRTMLGVQGRKYDLSIELDGKTYTSSSTMPNAVKIDSLFMYYIAGMGDAAFPMVWVKDPEGIENFYLSRLKINGKQMPDFLVFKDKDRDGTILKKLFPFDSDYNDKEEIQKGDRITVTLECIDKGAYDFFNTLRDQSNALTNPTSNIKGGALGYFNAYTIDSTSIDADWTK